MRLFLDKSWFQLVSKEMFQDFASRLRRGFITNAIGRDVTELLTRLPWLQIRIHLSSFWKRTRHRTATSYCDKILLNYIDIFSTYIFLKQNYSLHANHLYKSTQCTRHIRVNIKIPPDIETYSIPSKVPTYQILYLFSSLVVPLMLHSEGPNHQYSTRLECTQ